MAFYPSYVPRIAMTDEQRARHVPGTGVMTNGVKKFTDAHMNLSRSLSDVYDIKRKWLGSQTGNVWVWINRDTGREE